LLALLVCIAAAGCSDENPVIEEPTTLDDLVIANCYALRDSVEANATEDGYYQGPGWFEYENPYTNLEGHLRTFAVHPGETGYWEYWLDCCGYPIIGYLITGCGADGEVIALSNLPRGVFYFHEQVVANCLATKRAAEAYAADNDGIYPDDVSDFDDYLPDGSLLKNPYTGARTEPVDLTAASSGQTGYVEIVMGGKNLGYTITGYARTQHVITLIPGVNPEDYQVTQTAHVLRRAVEEFAANNGRAYPDDIDTDTTLAGNTILDLMGRPSSGYWWNPYTDQWTEPRSGLVGTRGQVGYVPMARQATNDGYVINAWGLFGEIIRFEK
jgi:hypothetical protein